MRAQHTRNAPVPCRDLRCRALPCLAADTPTTNATQWSKGLHALFGHLHKAIRDKLVEDPGDSGAGGGAFGAAFRLGAVSSPGGGPFAAGAGGRFVRSFVCLFVRSLSPYAEVVAVLVAGFACRAACLGLRLRSFFLDLTIFRALLFAVALLPLVLRRSLLCHARIHTPSSRPPSWLPHARSLFSPRSSSLHARPRARTLARSLGSRSGRYVDEKGIVRVPSGDPVHGGTTCSIVVQIKNEVPANERTHTWAHAYACMHACKYATCVASFAARQPACLPELRVSVLRLRSPHVCVCAREKEEKKEEEEKKKDRLPFTNFKLCASMS